MSVVTAGLGQRVLLGVGWLDRHPWLSLLLMVVLPVVGAYRFVAWSAYRAAAGGSSDRWQILSPLAFGMHGEARGSERPGPLGDPAPRLFGEWLRPHLEQGELTVAQLARRLERSVPELQATLYGVPVDSYLPSVTLVAAICDTLGLDRDEGRTAFFAGVRGSVPRGRTTPR